MFVICLWHFSNVNRQIKNVIKIKENIFCIELIKKFLQIFKYNLMFIFIFYIFVILIYINVYMYFLYF